MKNPCKEGVCKKHPCVPDPHGFCASRTNYQIHVAERRTKEIARTIKEIFRTIKAYECSRCRVQDDTACTHCHFYKFTKKGSEK